MNVVDVMESEGDKYGEWIEYQDDKGTKACVSSIEHLSVNPLSSEVCDDRCLTDNVVLEVENGSVEPNIAISKFSDNENVASDNNPSYENINVESVLRMTDVNNKLYLTWNQFNVIGDSAIIEIAQMATTYNYVKQGPKRHLVQGLRLSELKSSLKASAHIPDPNFKYVLMSVGFESIFDPSYSESRFKNNLKEIITVLLSEYKTEKLILTIYPYPKNADDKQFNRVRSINNVICAMKYHYKFASNV